YPTTTPIYIRPRHSAASRSVIAKLTWTSAVMLLNCSPRPPVRTSWICPSPRTKRTACCRSYDYQTQLLEPIGGMGMIGKAFGQRLNGLIKYNCKVTGIQQGDNGVTA